ncbi:hypothetical protein J5N97_018642 [Dioscorea zingiberensis]|uniref:Uncharacterized protein n=1 Tax=Dioscorea zingiberensis TaxID=325984 RepID=A0A9D5HC41_9LILI|nr:hypothetical protein J5N97_018642 [Dioscorea zingiberensis]
MGVVGDAPARGGHRWRPLITCLAAPPLRVALHLCALFPSVLMVSFPFFNFLMTSALCQLVEGNWKAGEGMPDTLLELVDSKKSLNLIHLNRAKRHWSIKNPLQHSAVCDHGPLSLHGAVAVRRFNANPINFSTVPNISLSKGKTS